MANVLRGLKQRSVSPTPSSKHDLELALESADDARDIAKDLLRRLPDYDGSEEESTARHQLPEQHFHVTVNAGTPSHPDLKLEGEVEIGPVKVRGLPKWAAVGIGLLVAGVTALLAARFAR